MPQTQMPATVHALDFAQCASITEHQLRAACRLTHDVEVVNRRCEKGIFLRPRGKPEMASPVRVAYALRPLPAWRAIEIIVGVFFEGFAEGRDTEEIVEWMTTQTTISRYKWMIEGSDLFILPRGRGFDAEMIAELESLAASLERKELALFAVYIEIRVPYGTH